MIPPVASQDIMPDNFPNLGKSERGYAVHAIVDHGDTLPYIWLNWVIVEEPMPMKTRKKYLAWTRLRNNVKIVYPYAILAAAKLKEFDIDLAKLPDEYSRKKFLKNCEKELKNQFSEELKNLSINQGKILMKLIDRETGKTTYSIVKELRGNFQAFIWQSLAALFGSSMKQEYDATGDDKLIEVAIRQVESGQF